MSERNFFNICVLSQAMVYWISFQNIYTFTYQKPLPHALVCLFLKSSKSFSLSGNLFLMLTATYFFILGTQLGGRGQTFPFLFWKVKKVSWFWGKKALILSTFGIKFSIQGVVLRVSRRKNSQILPSGAFFPCFFFDKIFIEVPWFYETSPVLKNFWLRACLMWQFSSYNVFYYRVTE